MRRVAAIDCGTNTIKLLVADLDVASGTERELAREMRMVRLGQGVDRAGRLTDEALSRVFGAIDEYVTVIAEHGPDALRFCATSAVRDAGNAETFTNGVRLRLGVSPEVMTGAEEARLAYDGATRALAGADISGPLLVLDIGGGSTELILGDPPARQGQPARVRCAESLDIGSVRMTERHLHTDPPTSEELSAAVVDVDAAIGHAGVPLEQARTVVGVAGTITTVAAGVLDLPGYDREAIHHAVLPVDDVRAMTRSLLTMTSAERAGLSYLHPGRVDVIGAGALILDRVLRRTSTSTLLVSEADILDGIAWSLV